MWMLLLGLLAGCVAGLFLPLSVPAMWGPYLAVLALVILDAILSGAYKQALGNFLPREFVQGLVANAILACALTFMGIRLALDLQLAVCAALIWRILMRFSDILERKELSQSALLAKSGSK